MEEKLEQVLNDLITFIENAGEFAAEQAPLVVQEILLRGKILTALWLIIPLSVTALLIWCIYATVQYLKKKKGVNALQFDDDASFSGEFVFGCFVLTVVNVGLIYAFAVNFVTVWFAPRLYVLNYLKDMF